MNSYPLALGLLVLGNLAAALSDVAVKLLDGQVAPFQYILLRQLLSLLVLVPLWWRQPAVQRRLYQPGITIIRAHLVLFGSACTLVALSYLPLASANALFYAAPLLMLPLSVFLLGERPGKAKTAATMLGFIGVVIVLRPSQFHWAAWFGLGTALTVALFNILARKLALQQTVLTTLMWTCLFSLPLAILLAAWQWQPLQAQEMGWIGVSALLILLYNALAVAAYRQAPASQIAVAEYSGLIFVALFGLYWFNEQPDQLTWLGIGMIILPLAPKVTQRQVKRIASYLLRPNPPSDKRKNITD